MTYERESDRTADGPKHGKTDEKNEPHVGGNTWAGGTGMIKEIIKLRYKWKKKC